MKTKTSYYINVYEIHSIHVYDMTNTDTVKNARQISTHNTSQSFGLFG